MARPARSIATRSPRLDPNTSPTPAGTAASGVCKVAQPRSIANTPSPIAPTSVGRMTIRPADSHAAKPEPIATATASDYAAALHLVRPRSAAWTPRVVRCSALEQRGVDELWAAVEDFTVALAGDELTERRRDQARAWMRDELADSLLDRMHADAATAIEAAALERDVAEGRIAPTTAARRLIADFLARR